MKTCVGIGRNRGRIVAGEVKNFEGPLKDFRFHKGSGESWKVLIRGVVSSALLIFAKMAPFAYATV